MAILFWRDTIILITRWDIAIQNVKETRGGGGGYLYKVISKTWY